MFCKYETNGINVCLPERYPEYAKSINQFEVREDDIYVAAFPKTGTTWLQEMVWLIGSDLDYETAKNKSISLRFPFFDDFTFANVLNTGLQDFKTHTLDEFNKMEGPRFMKTHVPYFLLPEQIQTGVRKPKIISIVRDPKDTCVSFYYFSKHFRGQDISLNEYATNFIKGEVRYGPYWQNVLSYWERRNQDNVLVVKYEDMKNDLAEMIKQVAVFLNKVLSEADVEKLVDHLSFDSMKNNKSVNKDSLAQQLLKLKVSKEKGTFLRCGKVGSGAEIEPKLANEFRELNNKYFQSTGLNY